MTTPSLYRGPWPQNVSKLAKYAVRSVGSAWRVTVLYEAGAGLTYLAVEGNAAELVNRINAVKSQVGDGLGGAFYINEYRHVLVPIKAAPEAGTGSVYYCAGTFHGEFTFEFEGKPLTTRPLGPDSNPLKPGDRWYGPRPGIPYVLAAGGGDVYYEMPALTDGEPPQVRANMTRKVNLSLVLSDKNAANRAASVIAGIKGHSGGLFYVNEHGAIFTPVGAGDGNGIEYVYCGVLDRKNWFPEPPIG